MKGLVSVIIPTYNRASFLKRAIESVLAQTYEAIEIIVVDDGSTDDTHTLVASYGDKVLFIRQNHEGASAARNRGLLLARGEFIAFLDSDDYWAKEKLAEQLTALEQHPEAAVCYTWYALVDQDEQFSRAICPQDKGDIFSAVYFRNHLITPHLLIKRSCFFEGEELILKFDPNLIIAEDFKLRLQLASAYHFCYVPKCLVYVTTHPGSTHSSYKVDEMVKCLRSVEEYLWQDPGTAKRLKRLGPRAKAAWRFEIAYLLLDKGRWTDAIKTVFEALQIYPLYWRAYGGILALLIGSRNVDRIIRIYHGLRYWRLRTDSSFGH